MPLSETIKAEARSLGFDAVGISRLPIPSDHQTAQAHDRRELFLSRLRYWLSRNFHGTMAWMERDPAKRADPQRVLPGCRSVISVGMNYLTNHRAHEQSGFGRIARYAWGKDYHRTLGKKLTRLEARVAALAPNVMTRSYVDTGPIMEKAWAQQAGLGWIGKHSNLVSAQFGSWLLLGEILTTLELDPDEPASDLCGSCSLCIHACPTGAIVDPYVVDANRCVSYLTIEFRGPQEAIPDDLASKMGNRIFGCDDCLDVCPFNLRGETTTEPAFDPSPGTLAPRLDELGDLQEHTFAETFRGSSIRRAKRQGFARNVAIAQANLSHRPRS